MKKNKVDKGFELFYSNLSYRRKFIRTIWLAPIVILLGVFITYFNLFVSIFYWIISLIVFIIQLKYNYTMWKKEIKK